MFHERSKHIDIQMHFIREIIARGEIKVEKVASEKNLANALAKFVAITKF